jgi:hypothetical protein
MWLKLRMWLKWHMDEVADVWLKWPLAEVACG